MMQLQEQRLRTVLKGHLQYSAFLSFSDPMNMNKAHPGSHRADRHSHKNMRNRCHMQYHEQAHLKNRHRQERDNLRDILLRKDP